MYLNIQRIKKTSNKARMCSFSSPLHSCLSKIVKMIVNTEQKQLSSCMFFPVELLKCPGNWKTAGEGEKSRHLHHRILEARCHTPVDKCRKNRGSIIYPGLVEGQKMGWCEDDSLSVTYTGQKKPQPFPVHPSPIIALATSLCQSLFSPVMKSHQQQCSQLVLTACF